MSKHPKPRAAATGQQNSSTPRTDGASMLPRKNSELRLLNRYQRSLLFGGGAIVSLVVLFTAGFSAYSSAGDYVAEARSVFLAHKAMLQNTIEVKQTLFLRAIISSEHVLDTHRQPDPQLMHEFSMRNGRVLVRQSALKAPYLVLAQITPARPASAFSDYLSFVEQMSYEASATVELEKRPWTGYTYSPDDAFLTVRLPRPIPDNLVKQMRAQDTGDLVEQFKARLGKLADFPFDATRLDPHKVLWFPPSAEPLTGRTTMKMVLPVFRGDKLFLVAAVDVETQQLADQLRQSPYDGEFLVLDRTGKIILRSGPNDESDNALANDAIATHAWEKGFDRLTSNHRDGIFMVSERLSGTDWVVVYVYSWRTIVKALLPDWMVTGAATLGLLCLLWLCPLLFNRKVFAPVYARSQRVFESENLSRSIISMAPVGLGLLSTKDATVLLQNNVTQSYRSSTDHDVPPLEQQFLTLYEQHAADDTHRASAHPITVEFPLRQADAKTCDLLVSLVKTKYQGASVLLFTFSDITARKNIERAQIEARKAADAANKAKSTFLAMTSHELRTPLNAIIGHLELLNRTALSPSGAERLKTIISSSRNLLDITNDILDFSKVESGDMTFERIRFDVVEIIEQIAETFMPLAQAKGLSLSCRIDPAVTRHYLGDPTRTRQIVVNLVSNAIKFTEAGHVIVDVYNPVADTANPPLTISVSDTGIGIPADCYDQIFDAFSQADSSITRRFGGTGLGLALCKRMVELMGGTITVTSEVGAGSTFTVTLPLMSAPEPGVEATEPAEPAPVLPDMRGIHVLVVEDHPVNRELIRDQLDVLGFTSDVAENGLVALRYFNERHYDLVMTDLGMPVMDGYTLATCLRNQGAQVPIIAITAHVTANENQRAQQAGISDVLLKPMSLETIDQTLRRHLQAACLETHQTGATTDRERPILTKTLYETLVSSTAESLSAARDALNAGNMRIVLERLHSLKGSFAMIHEPEVAEVFARLEELGRSGNAAELSDEFMRLQALLEPTFERLAMSCA